MSEINEEVVVAPKADEEGADPTATKVAELEAELSKRDETIGSLKREVKDAKKSKAPEKKDPLEKKPENDKLLERLDKQTLRSAGVTKKEEVELALATAKKWDMDVDALVDDDDFTEKLEKFRTKQANLDATSDVKGDKSGGSAKDKPEYWIAKGVPPTREQIPDRKARVKIAKAMVKGTKSNKTFYSD